MASIGFLGCGKIGKAMVRHIQAHGKHHVGFVHDPLFVNDCGLDCPVVAEWDADVCRADLVVEFDDHRARGWVSRGQQKLVAAALVLGQASVLAPLWKGRGILLVDDPAAELDAQRLGTLLDYIAELPFQVFLTALDKAGLARLDDARVFHVEQGEVRRVV